MNTYNNRSRIFFKYKMIIKFTRQNIDKEYLYVSENLKVNLAFRGDHHVKSRLGK